MNQEIELKREVVTKQICEDFLFSSKTKLTEQQKAMFLALAIQFNLNPFKREIYAIRYGEDFNFVTGYQVYIARAEATGKLNGWKTESVFDTEEKLIGARIFIWRKDWEKEFVWEVSLKEFNKDSRNWKIMPEFMIKKVVIGQGFRLAFPNELGGMPYLQEEIETESNNEVELATEKQKVFITKLLKSHHFNELKTKEGNDLRTETLEKLESFTKERASACIEFLEKIIKEVEEKEKSEMPPTPEEIGRRAIRERIANEIYLAKNEKEMEKIHKDNPDLFKRDSELANEFLAKKKDLQENK